MAEGLRGVGIVRYSVAARLYPPDKIAVITHVVESDTRLGALQLASARVQQEISKSHESGEWRVTLKMRPIPTLQEGE